MSTPDLNGFLRRVFQSGAKPALSSDGIAVGYGIEKFDIVPGASRRLAALQALIAVASMAGSAMPVEKLSATQLARRCNMTTSAIQQKLARLGYIEVRNGLHFFTDLGRAVGGDIRKNHPDALEGHMVWPVDLFDRGE